MTVPPGPEGSWPAYPPLRDAQPGRVPRTNAVVVILAAVLVMLLGVCGAVYAMMADPKPTASPIWTSEPSPASTRSPTSGSSASASSLGNCRGSNAGTPDWHAIIPLGWSCKYMAGREIYLVSDTFDTIDVSATTGSPASACSSRMFDGTSTVTTLPDSSWGGRTARTVSVTYNAWVGQARCASSKKYTYVMLGMVNNGTLEGVVAAEASLAVSWAWSS